MSSRSEAAIQTRRNLIAAFWEIYQTKRIEKITVREITDRAGYHRGTFYEYFTDVYQVLEELEDTLIPDPRELPVVSQAIQPEKNSRDDSPFAKSFQHFMNLYEKYDEYYCVLTGPNGDPAFSRKVIDRIKQGILSYYPDECKTTDTLEYSLEYTLSGILGIMTFWRNSESKLPKRRLAQIIYELSEYGMQGKPLP